MRTVAGAAVIVAESVTVELPWLSPTDVIVTATGYVPADCVGVVPVTVKLPLLPLTVPGEVLPSPQLIVAEYALAVALVFGSVIVATVPPTDVPGAPANEKPPAGTVSTISVSNEKVIDPPGADAVGERATRSPSRCP